MCENATKSYLIIAISRYLWKQNATTPLRGWNSAVVMMPTLSSVEIMTTSCVDRDSKVGIMTTPYNKLRCSETAKLTSWVHEQSWHHDNSRLSMFVHTPRAGADQDSNHGLREIQHFVTLKVPLIWNTNCLAWYRAVGQHDGPERLSPAKCCVYYYYHKHRQQSCFEDIGAWCLVTLLIHWGREMHIYALVNQATFGSDNGLSPVRRRAIIWTSGCVLIIGPLGTYLSEI